MAAQIIQFPKVTECRTRMRREPTVVEHGLRPHIGLAIDPKNPDVVLIEIIAPTERRWAVIAAVAKCIG